MILIFLFLVSEFGLCLFFVMIVKLMLSIGVVLVFLYDVIYCLRLLEIVYFYCLVIVGFYWDLEIGCFLKVSW